MIGNWVRKIEDNNFWRSGNQANSLPVAFPSFPPDHSGSEENLPLLDAKSVIVSKMSAADLEKFRAMLIELQRRLKGDVEMMSVEALGGVDSDSGDNRAPIHPAEAGTHSFEQEFTLNLLSNDGDRLERIEAALERIASGEYGSCEECGGRIPKARLEVIPDTPYCVKCASQLGR